MKYFPTVFYYKLAPINNLISKKSEAFLFGSDNLELHTISCYISVLAYF